MVPRLRRQEGRADQFGAVRTNTVMRRTRSELRDQMDHRNGAEMELVLCWHRCNHGLPIYVLT
jgi:hypothetical protein